MGSPAECAELMKGLDLFQALCARLGRLEEQSTFIEGCRWHFEHYPHYLGRHRHFADYATYIRERNGSLKSRHRSDATVDRRAFPRTSARTAHTGGDGGL